MAKPIRILSIDGGGVRGLIPALVLSKLEKLTGRPVSDLFDLIAGTSTGGILALGLTMQDTDGRPAHTAEQMAAIYEKESSSIFAPSFSHRFRPLTEQKYGSEGIERVLDRYFGSARLKDSRTSVLVPSFEIERYMPFFFRSDNARVDAAYDFPIKDVARATSAAPTYFEPHRIPASTSGDYYALIDGGVFANNPAACALVEAMKRHPRAVDFLVVSLGTGGRLSSLAFTKAKSWGLAQWAKPVLNLVLDAGSATVDYQLQQLSKVGQYFRFQPVLEDGCVAMDNTNPANLRRLRLTAEAMIRQKRLELDKIAEMLLA